jgi:hypothetical protein
MVGANARQFLRNINAATSGILLFNKRVFAE